MKTKTRQNGKVVVFLVVVIAAFAAGYFFANRKAHINTETETSSPAATQIWTCSMHPQIKQDHPGLCPLCNMDLIPVSDNGSDDGPGEISFSENATRLMDLETTKVQRRAVEAQIRLKGRVSYDETRVSYITAWTSGRINRMFVDFTGTRVIKGDHMVELYSPELNTARQEYLQAYLATEKTDNSELVKKSAQTNMLAAREKLLLLGVSQGQIDSLAVDSKTWDYITINSPESGIVIEKHKNKGAYVKPGDAIYTIADLDRLWVMLDAYESDLLWIRYGQHVEFSTGAYPGENFTGTVSFISPTVDPQTRTIKVRLNVDNAAGLLKPDMFIKAIVRSKVAATGAIMDSKMAGKWICPMHPSIVKIETGTCDICQMPLVTTESLGYVEVDENMELPLVIPATAPMITGKRAVVYVKVPHKERPTYIGREVVLGPRVGLWYQVKDGLAEGEEVVTSGNFKIDSALQIMAQTSMMNPVDKTSDMDMSDMAAPGEQTNCPVMGGPINKEFFVEYKGKKVYFCCGGCDKMFLADPEKYMDKLPQFKGEHSGMEIK